MRAAGPPYWGAVLIPISVGQVLSNLTMFQAMADVPNIDVVYWTFWAETRFYILILALTWIGVIRSRVVPACTASLPGHRNRAPSARTR